MMDVREKLIGLIAKAKYISKNGIYAKYWCEMPKPPKGE